MAKALTAWDFAVEIQRRALVLGRPIVLWSEGVRVLWAIRGTKAYEDALEHDGLIGVYDGDVLVRDLAKDLEGYFR